MSAIQDRVSSDQRLGILRCTLTGAASLGVLFFLCWAGAVILPTIVPHMFVALFTSAIFTTVAALVQGLCSSVFFGALAGALVAAFYNLFGGSIRTSETRR